METAAQPGTFAATARPTAMLAANPLSVHAVRKPTSQPMDHAARTARHAKALRLEIAAARATSAAQARRIAALAAK